MILDAANAATARKRRLHLDLKAMLLVTALLVILAPTGTAIGEAHYAVLVKPGETIWTGDGRQLRVLDVVPVEDEASPFVGLLRVEAV